jgi:membrane-bound ClpP family serine protease
MKPNVVITIFSLLSILLITFHLTDDIVRGFEPGGLKNIFGVVILVMWLYGTLVLAERRSGLIIILLGSFLGTIVPVVHMTGAGLVGGKIAGTGGIFLWVWTLIALSVTAIFSVILSALGLWSLQRRQPRHSTTRTLHAEMISFQDEQD